MSKLLHILATVLVLISLQANIFAYAINSNDIQSLTSKTSTSSQSSIQNTLAEKLPNGKKQLKKKLSLDYTNPKFDSELGEPQKNAILKSLKKWKLDLPINNTFTVTSIADLKKNQKVIYMWSVTPNPNWDNSRQYNTEDYESGDPKTIRTEFNVLLKKSNGNWKATLERDNELKSELKDIPESEVTNEEKNVLFGANKSENNFTDAAEILVDTNSSVSSSSISSILSSSSSSIIPISSFQNISSSISSTSSTTNQSANSSSNTTIGLLDILFNSPKVSAGPSDYSWPWKSGDTYNVSQGWHGSGVVGSYDGYDAQEGKAYKDYSLDISSPTIGGKDILAPISGSIERKCEDASQATFKIGRMRIMHASANSFADGVSYTKGQKMGVVYPSPISSNCAYSTGAHLHIKFFDNNMVVDGTTITYGSSYSSFTSNNGSSTTPPPSATPKIMFRRKNTYVNTSNTGQCLNIYNPQNYSQVNTWKCNPNDADQKWESFWNGIGYSYRRVGTTKCMNANNPTDSKILIMYECDNTDRQAFNYDWVTQRLYRVGTANNNQCVGKNSPSDGSPVVTANCDYYNDPQWKQNFQWDILTAN